MQKIEIMGFEYEVMGANELIPFSFGGKEVRTGIFDGQEGWVGKDVAVALGYKNPADALKRHCKGVVKRYPLQTEGGIQEVRIISEGDVFRLIVNSNLPEAERFETWLFDEVLPSIRKTGSYTIEKLEEKIEELESDYRSAVSIIQQDENYRLKYLDYLDALCAEFPDEYNYLMKKNGEQKLQTRPTETDRK